MVWVVIAIILTGLIFFIAINNPRYIAAIMGAFLLVFGIVAVAAYVMQRGENSGERKANEFVAIAARVDPAKCPDKSFPLAISFVNKSAVRSIKRVDFEITGYRKNFSTPLYNRKLLTSDRILAPASEYTSCWALPPLRQTGSQSRPAGQKDETVPDDLDWQIAVTRAE